MRVFVTGASGWIGSASIQELLANGHQVLGLARSEASAGRVAALGAEVHRGDLDDLATLEAGAAGADAVLHLGYHHDFAEMEKAAALDRGAVETFGRVLEGTGKALMIASGTLGLATGRVATEEDSVDPDAQARSANAIATLALAERGVRSIVTRFPPTVHGTGDHGFIAHLSAIAREKGVAGYPGDGANRWAAVHVSDAARMVVLGLEKAPAGSRLHAVAEEGVPTKAIAEAIGRAFDLPVASIDAAAVPGHFGWIGGFFAMDLAATSTATQELLGWTPTGKTLIEDLDTGAYSAS